MMLLVARLVSQLRTFNSGSGASHLEELRLFLHYTQPVRQLLTCYP